MEANDRARALLDAHVAYILAQTEGPALTAFLEAEIERGLEDAAAITLEEAVSRDMIKDTAHSYAIELEVAGAIPELVGDIARAIHEHDSQKNTTLRELLSDEVFDQFVEKILELRELREWLIHEFVAQPIYSELATDTLVEGLRGYLRTRSAKATSLLPQLPGVESALRLGRALGGEALPRVEDAIEESVRAYLRDNLRTILTHSERFLVEHFDEERVRTILAGLYDELKQRTLSSALSKVSSRDVEDLFVIAYEGWRELRHTAYYRMMIDAGIDSFFDKYGDASLLELLEELGIGRAIMRREAMRFAPPVLAMLRDKGMLEPIVRRHLEAFYASPEAQRILGS